jgi:hypothetical protein
MNGLKDLLHSERGMFCILALVAATLLATLGRIDAAMWLDFVKWLTGALVLSKTITTAVETHATKEPQIPTPEIPAARVVRDDLPR